MVGLVPDAIGAGIDSPSGRRLVVAIVVTAVLFVAQQALPPFRLAATRTLGRRVDNLLRLRAMYALGDPHGIAHLEDPSTLYAIRDAQGLGAGRSTPGAAAVGLLSNAENRLSSVLMAIVVASWRWWVALAVFAMAVLIRHRLLAGMLEAVWGARRQTGVLRRSDYLREVALTPAAAKETRIFGLASWITGRFADAWTSAMRTLWDERRRTSPSTLRWTVAHAAVIGGALLVAARDAVSGSIDIGTFVILIGAIYHAANVWFSDADFDLVYGTEALPAVRRLEEAAAAVRASGVADPDGAPRVAVRFEDVTFRYAGRTDDVLSALTLEIEAGRSLAIVGRNGAGKTTLVKLLSRFYEPTHGAVLVDGVDLRTIDVSDWRAAMSAGFQDFARFEFLARETVGVGSLQRLGDRAFIAGALGRAHAEEVVDQLPDGLDSQLGRTFDGGVELSHGQWQKLALGRAMMRPAPLLLVLDEPTAALDAQTEHALFERYAGAARDAAAANGGITVLVSHRFSTVRMADLIVVIEGGSVVECGSHTELMQREGLYAELYSIQARAYA